jgi:ADP-heptose:LPS heptosyltransferase
VGETEYEMTEPEVKVIAIKLPFDLQERLLSFPFLHALREFYPESEIHFITPKKHIEVLNLLPFQAYYHEFDEDEIQSVFDTHRFSVNSKIYKVDLFINLTNSLADAALGIGLKAKKRLGFSDGWKTMVLNEKTTRPVNHHLSEDFFALLELHTKAPMNQRLRVVSRDLAPIIKDWEGQTFFAINLYPLLDGVEIDPKWIELFNLFENQNFVLFASEDEVKNQMLIKNFMDKLPRKNNYFNFAQKTWIELARMLAQSNGLITYNGPVATLCAYVGTRTLILYDREDPKRTGPFYFFADVVIVSGEEDKTGTLKARTKFNMVEVFNRACDFFRI